MESKKNQTPLSCSKAHLFKFQLWGRAFLDSFRNHGAERDEGNTWNREREFDDESLEGMSRRQRRVFPPQRVSFRRTRPIRNQYLQGFVDDTTVDSC